jgi:hypothetical protein
MSFRFTDADLSSDSDSDNSFTSAMDAEMSSPQQNPQQPPQQPPQPPQQAPPAPSAPNPIDALIVLRAAGSINDEQYARLTGALVGSGAPRNTDDIEDHRIQARLASLTEFRGDKTDFHMAHRWILAVERDLHAIGLRQQQWSLACFLKMPLDSPASLWAESIYGNGGTFTEPDWDAWKTNFLGQFLNPNELQM